jgi:hypothetical protein
MHMKLLQLVDVCVDEASRPRHEELSALKLLLVCVLVFLWSQLRHVLVLVWGSPKCKLRSGLDSSEKMSSVVEEEHFHGYFSPHGPSSLPNESAASEHEGMAMITTQTLDLELSDVVDASVYLSHESGEHVVAK